MVLPSEHDKVSRVTTLNYDSPFIKIRQFADDKISSLLQGIIGLPSAFSRTQTYHGQWDHMSASPRDLLDKNLKERREESDETPIPVKKFNGSTSPSENRDLFPTAPHLGNYFQVDVPLYSRVSKPLFAQMLSLSDTRVDWAWIDRFQTFDNGNPIKFLLLNSMPPVFPMTMDNKNSSRTGNVKLNQIALFNELSKSSNYESNYSLLPYLAFSQYSPLNLTINAETGQKDSTFPYCHAFQDLIETTLKASQPSLENNCNQHTIQEKGNIRPEYSARDSIEWIKELDRRGILHQKQTDYSTELMHSDPMVSDHSEDKYPRGLETELDVYEYLSKFTSQLQTTVNRFLHSGESQDNFSAGPAVSPGKNYESLWEETIKLFNRERDQYTKELSSKKETSSCVMKTSSPENGTERVISSHTISKQYPGEDGKPYTIIESSKTFSDGHKVTWTKLL
ncbi:Bgt-4377 [Blumeria graminis f. sp. tritici]|uniref:Bgt-4377 n=2 Tax=Blumeria graminis f. sp. tritici TaxID=62690 RepID=A0A381L8W8_BLUGR|nr:hypothetical protein BGT96224_4377 [Blumeria graminis f. sp. tritici 96224]VCU40494.1 Bgt-4377 [Blumeria graminis f. sp. tritici]